MLTRWVTAIAGCAVICVALDAAVVAVRFGLLMFMTIDATEHGVVARVRMTGVARAPFHGVTAAIDRNFVVELRS